MDNGTIYGYLIGVIKTGFRSQITIDQSETECRREDWERERKGETAAYQAFLGFCWNVQFGLLSTT